ncbi:hypothetical protein ACFV0R_29785 [Streptomyces sp. NPDC059578]|uniref:hypothetical protein n=1 Tax=Streptomyces sp. NPDC059578 TaxID=3346874 RepID=UPI0036CAA803
MGWNEWEQLKAEAIERRSDSMRLNQVPGDPEGGPADGGSPQAVLKVTQADLAKVGDHAFGLYERLWTEGRVSVDSTEKAAGSLKGQGFALGGALHHVSTRWEEQLTSLRDACAHISNHLEFTKRTHRGDEQHVRGELSGIRTLDQGFDEKVGGPGTANPVYESQNDDKDDKDDRDHKGDQGDQGDGGEKG